MTEAMLQKIGLLQESFPYFEGDSDDSFADVLAKKLSKGDIKKLMSHCKKEKDESIVEYMRYLLTFDTQKAIINKMKEVIAKWEAKDNE